MLHLLIIYLGWLPGKEGNAARPTGTPVIVLYRNHIDVTDSTYRVASQLASSSFKGMYLLLLLLIPLGILIAILLACFYGRIKKDSYLKIDNKETR
jgi:hypothetical protein